MAPVDNPDGPPDAPPSKVKAVLIGLSVVGAGFVVGLVINAIRKPCPCNERLGEAEASAEAVALAGAAMGQYPAMPDFGTPRIPTVSPVMPGDNERNDAW